MKRVLIFGNSGSGKSTLARELAAVDTLVHLDLDTLAWLPVTPPERKPLDIARREIESFMASSKDWVIEGCYGDLLEISVPFATEMIYLNLPVEQCVINARKRPWEPHKYDSKEAQDANLEMLLEWISQYDQRQDCFSQAAHQALFDCYSGEKKMYTSNCRKVTG